MPANGFGFQKMPQKDVKMSKKIALVTGAMGGLGTAICQSLAKDGFKVVANCLPNFEHKEGWLSAQRDLGFDFVAAEGDVSNYESCAVMVAKVEAELGPIDVLVNNAGITRDKFFPKMEKGQWDAVINTNLNSLFNVTHHVSAKMAERGWGRIINISSVNGVKGQAGQTNYSTAKAGVLGFTKALAAELATKGVTVNAIAPGYIGTDMVMAIRDTTGQNAAAYMAARSEQDDATFIGGVKAQFGDEIDGVLDIGLVLAARAQGVDPGQTHAEENRVIVLLQIGQMHIAAKRLAVVQGDPADLHQPRHLGLREVVGGFVAGDAIFVQTARLGTRVEDHDVMALHRQAMRAGKPCRPRPHHCNFPA